ncbi:unnamed protein product [Peniophora sp. CBMAI 1063]|nr:unnamed protein product [Peniophora sp. CBMAI 1063]
MRPIEAAIYATLQVYLRRNIDLYVVSRDALLANARLVSLADDIEQAAYGLVTDPILRAACESQGADLTLPASISDPRAAPVESSQEPAPSASTSDARSAADAEPRTVGNSGISTGARSDSTADAPSRAAVVPPQSSPSPVVPPAPLPATDGTAISSGAAASTAATGGRPAAMSLRSFVRSELPPAPSAPQNPTPQENRFSSNFSRFAPPEDPVPTSAPPTYAEALLAPPRDPRLGSGSSRRRPARASAALPAPRRAGGRSVPGGIAALGPSSTSDSSAGPSSAAERPSRRRVPQQLSAEREVIELDDDSDVVEVDGPPAPARKRRRLGRGD